MTRPTDNDRAYPDTLAGNTERLRDACRDFVRALPWIGPRAFPPVMSDQ